MADAPAVDPGTLAAWLHGRSIARDLPPPVPDRGGWRVDTRSPTEARRYVFATPEPGFDELAMEIEAPGIALRLCVDDATMRRLLPDRWALGAPSYAMIGPSQAAGGAMPVGYAATLSVRGGAIECLIHAADGTLAASGYAAETDGAFVYDRIVVAPEHWRRGLGRALMAALGAERRSRASRPLLVATDMGRALYAALGWRTIGPYAAAVIPGPPA